MKVKSKREEIADQAAKSTLTGIALSVVLVFIKGIAGVLGSSYALIADAIESASDVVTSLILWLGIRVAARQPDKDHPYGHGKAEPIAAVVVAISLFAAAILIAVQSIENMLTPHDLPASFTLWVLAIVVISKELIFRYVIKIGEETESSAVKADAWHHRSDAITSAAAFIGISIALWGGKGYEAADDWAALFSSVIIIVNAYLILKPAFAEIMDAAPSDEMVERTIRVAQSVESVLEIEKCLIRKMGFEYFADMHVKVDGSLSVYEGHRIAHLVKDAVLKDNDKVSDVLIHIEPFSSPN
ncbi:MAG TPA: cation diffusion facilitator family transporter [Cytophagaceae bacterium]|jgi:cation diffusion facilitator family transporter|nr:cation diffusion facilitator family transporter [Cytophagaceae bacterium]